MKTAVETIKCLYSHIKISPKNRQDKVEIQIRHYQKVVGLDPFVLKLYAD
jgi:hypothetical protein